MSTDDDEIASLKLRVARLEELTRSQGFALISIWGALSDSEGRHSQFSKEIEADISKMVDLFEAAQDG